jgi:hypothetical protein
MQSLAIYCLFEGRNQQTAKTHIEMWPDRSEVDTHIVRIGHILELDLDKKEAFLRKATKCQETLGSVTAAIVQEPHSGSAGTSALVRSPSCK